MLNKCQVEVEVERLNILKTSKMRELIFKRQAELEEIYRGVHMDIDGDAARKTLTSLIDSGLRLILSFKFPSFSGIVLNLDGSFVSTCLFQALSIFLIYFLAWTIRSLKLKSRL